MIVRSIGCALPDRGDRICALRVNQAPQRNRLIEELPAVARFIDGLGVVERLGAGRESNGVKGHGVFPGARLLLSRSLQRASRSVAVAPNDLSKPLPAGPRVDFRSEEHT